MLVEQPTALFDTEHCAPYPDTLTFGIPMVTMGILGIPAMLATDDPVWTYNFVLTLMTALAALAMYLLVTWWTGSQVAGIVAGLLYAFHPFRLGNILHPSVWDTTWTVFALYFSHRLFAAGRWIHALGLAIACALQIAASIYPLIAAALVSPPYIVWLLRRYGLREIKPGQIALVVVAALAAVVAVLLPYITAQAADAGMQRDSFFYAPLSSYFSGGRKGLGWMVILLAGVAIAGRGRGMLTDERGDPRRALLIGAAIVALVAAGDSLNASLRSIAELPFALPNLHTLLAAFVPGLDSIRGIDRLSAAVQVVAVALAGIGAAALLQIIGANTRLHAAAATGLVIAAFLVATRPFGLPNPAAWELAEIAPDSESVEFASYLANPAEAGAVFEFPFHDWIAHSPSRIFATLQHRRRTSACFGSYRPAAHAALADTAKRLPRSDAVAELHDLGFSTVVFHVGNPWPSWDIMVNQAKSSGGPYLEMVYSSEKGRIYDIIVPSDHRRPAFDG